MNTLTRSMLWVAVGLLVRACTHLGYRTHGLSQQLAALRSRTLPYDIK